MWMATVVLCCSALLLQPNLMYLIPFQVEDSPKPVRQPKSSPSSKALKKQTQKAGGVSQVDPTPSPRKTGGKKSKKSKVNTAIPAALAQPSEEDNEGKVSIPWLFGRLGMSLTQPWSGDWECGYHNPL